MSNFDDPRGSAVRTNLLGAGKPKPASDAATQLVVPPAERVAEGEHIKVTTIGNLGAIAGLPVPGAVAFVSERLARLALDNADLLAVSFVKLTDYPDAEYTPEFERMTWDLPTVSYNELLADVAAEKRRTIALDAQAGARQKGPRREQTLDRDRTRHFDGFARAKGALASRTASESGDDDGDVDPTA